jgi:hypothetical protein
MRQAPNSAFRGLSSSRRGRTNEQNAAEIAAALESLGFKQVDDQTNTLRQQSA